MRNLAAINAEDQIFELSEPNVFVVDPKLLKKQMSGRLKQVSPKSNQSPDKTFVKFPRNSLPISETNPFGKTLFASGQDVAFKQTMNPPLEHRSEDPSAFERISKQELP